MVPSSRLLKIEVFDVVPSTNDTILEAGENGLPEGTTHIARSQTGGRGRGGHTWWSPPGAGLWMSTLLRPARHQRFWGGISLLAGKAVQMALEELGIPRVDLYWPNDLKVGRRKIGGILGEARSHGRAWLALGIGVNIDFSAEELRKAMPAEILGLATSMVECGKPATTDPESIARVILKEFWPLYDAFERGEELPAVIGTRLGHIGREVEIRIAGSLPWRGEVEGIGAEGELLVRAGQALPDPPPGGSWIEREQERVAVRAGEVVYLERG